MKPDKKLEKLIREAKKNVFLTEEEKKKALSLLVSFIKKNPLKKEELISHNIVGNFASFFTLNKLMIRYTSLVFVVLLIVATSGISFAANNSLPGNFLYPFKVGVNEKVLGFILFSNEAKAKYNAGLAELRLQELEKITLRGELDDKTKKEIVIRFNNHIEKAKKQSNNVKAKRNVELSTEIESDLEASLKAHSRVLGKLSESGKSEAAEKIKNFLPDVEIKINELKQSRQESENDLAKKPLADIKFAAEGKLKAAESKIREVDNFIEDKRSDLSQESYSTAKDNLKAASDVVLRGKAELEAENYSRAFSLFQKAIRLSQEVKISIDASIKLNIELPKLEEHKENNGDINNRNHNGNQNNSNNNGNDDNGNDVLKIKNKINTKKFPKVEL